MTQPTALSPLTRAREELFAGNAAAATPLVKDSLGPGRSLPNGVMREMNQHFEHDFSRVRIHTDAPAARATRALEANAFATGNDIAFAPGMFRPETPTGRLRLGHELAHTIQQSGSTRRSGDALEAQASTAAVLGSRYTPHMQRIAPTIQREPTYPRRSTQDQMTAEARRVLAQRRDTRATDDTLRMWSNVTTNFASITTGSIARRIWTHIFLRHFTEPDPRGGVESVHPRYLYSHQYGWIDAQHFFGFIDFAEQEYRRRPGQAQEAFTAATERGLEIEQDQQTIRDYVILQRPPATGVTRHMQVRPPNTPFFRLPRAAANTAMHGAARIAAAALLGGTQRELYQQLDRRQRMKFFMDSAKSAFTFEDFVSNQLGTRFFFQHGIAINAAPEADRERMFLSALSTFFTSIRVENNQAVLDRHARTLPMQERFEAPKTTEARERQRHPELFQMRP